MKHEHIYDAQGKQLCCTQEEKIYTRAGAGSLIQTDRSEDSCCATPTNDHSSHESTTTQKGNESLRLFFPAVVSLLLLLSGLWLDQQNTPTWFMGTWRLMWYLAAYAPVGFPVIREAVQSIRKGDVFSEFFLMSIATVGAFSIGEFPEGVAVMLFYSVGEVFQTLAVRRAKANIKALLDQRPDEVTVVRNGQAVLAKAVLVSIGEVIRLKPGEKLALDGVLISDKASFNTAALTGESMPDNRRKDEAVLAGMINLNTACEVRVTTAYEDSKLSRILELVQEATSRKAPTELFIRKFARIYTPVVVVLAVLIVTLPGLLSISAQGNVPWLNEPYIFQEWLHRALIFLVISCPCALVISIPLGYFGGIGAASRHGILFKGSNFLDIVASIHHVVFDKTGTITEGEFKVQEDVFYPGVDRMKILTLVDQLEGHSSHPVATAIHSYVGNTSSAAAMQDIEEIAGHGLRATVDGKVLLVGNLKLMEKFGVSYDPKISEVVYTLVAIAYDGKFVGYLTIADKIKADALEAIQKLQSMRVSTTMLSGDKSSVVNFVARQTGISNAYGDLLPEDKVNKVKEIIQRGETVAFVGDGVNDAPAVALSHAGIAMGGLGSDATIETADVVIQDDRPSKLPVAISIGRKTKLIVWQNITMAFLVKIVVLILGAGGLATMWEAVFADVGVALLAIFNAIRIQQMNFGK